MSSLPENSAMAVPSPVGEKKESCFSAVMPVRGWNQWVKWVAPFSIAQSFIAEATASASEGSSGSPRSSVSCSERRSEEHTSELQSRQYLVCRLLLEKKKNTHL